MKKKLITSIVIVAVVAYAGWRYFAPTANNSSPVTAENQRRQNVQNSANNDLRPAEPVASQAPAAVILKPKLSPMAQAFQNAKSLKPFYDRYMTNPQAADAETMYYAAQTIQQCRAQALMEMRKSPGQVMTFFDPRGSTQPQPQLSVEAKVANFTSTLKPNDPNNAQRIEAFTVLVQRCAGFDTSSVKASDIDKMYTDAAAAGHSAAQMKVARDAYFAEGRYGQDGEQGKLSEDQLAQVRSALQSGDPLAIRAAGELLDFSGTGRGGSAAWTMVACDAGSNCGPTSPRVLGACAEQGQCGYQNLETYMQFHELPPDAYVTSRQRRADIVTAIQSSNWNALGIGAGSGRAVSISPPRNNAPGGMTGGGVSRPATGAGAATGGNTVTPAGTSTAAK